MYSTFASRNPEWEHHLRQLVLDTNQPNPLWALQGHWPVGTVIPGFESWTRGWWEEYGYDYENQVAHLEIAAVAPTQIDANTVYFNTRNIPGWGFAIEN
ncbi:MAG: hypothetical protein AAFV43_01450 [Planctomycetota bacterium]